MGQATSQLGASTQPQGKGGFGGAPTPMQESQNPMQQPGMGAAMQGKGGMAGMPPTQDPMQQPAMMGGMSGMGGMMGGMGGEMANPMQKQLADQYQQGMGQSVSDVYKANKMMEKQPFEGSRMAPTRPQFGQPNPYTNTTPEMGNPQMMSGMQGGQAGGKGQPMMPQGKGQ
jgi:hypothetical protein